MRDEKSQIKKLKKKLSEIQTQARIGTWEWDKKSNKIEWSDMMFVLLGYEPNSVMPSYELALSHVHEEDKYKYVKNLDRVRITNKAYYQITKVIKKDKTIISVVSRGQCLKNKKGDIIRWMGTVQDITKYVNNEQNTLAKEIAEESNRLKSAFIANMSHEIRTPMNAMLGFTQLLKRNNLTIEKREKYLEFIESGGRRLLRIISDVVDLSKMDTNHLMLSYETCNLNKLLTKLQEEFNLNIKDLKQMVIIRKGLSNDNSYIITDQTRLEQILSNLIENSVKYAPNGNILVGYTKIGETLKFYVRDHGEGIEEKNHKSIFERFKQVENEYSRTNTSTGLGLSIVKELTELMKGKVWVESEKGQGAAFYFTIPYQKANRRLNYTNNQTISIEMDKEEVILIAEDESINFMYLEALFEKYQFKILHAKNGKEAISMVKEYQEISLVLMDIKMPIMNGIEATKQIRKTNKKLPIIALTAYVMDEDKEKMLSAKFNDYLAKPIDEITLINMVKKLQKINN